MLKYVSKIDFILACIGQLYEKTGKFELKLRCNRRGYSQMKSRINGVHAAKVSIFLVVKMR